MGTYRDKAVSPWFDQLKSEPWVKLEYTIHSENIMRMLLSGRVDAVIENKATVLYELHNLDRVSDAKILSPPVYVTPAFIAFSKKGKALPFLGEFERELGEFKKSKEYQTIVNTYGKLWE